MRGCIEPKRNFDPNFTIVEKKTHLLQVFYGMKRKHRRLLIFGLDWGDVGGIPLLHRLLLTAVSLADCPVSKQAGQ